VVCEAGHINRAQMSADKPSRSRRALRGDPPPQPIETTAGEKLLLQQGGGFKLQKPVFQVAPTAPSSAAGGSRTPTPTNFAAIVAAAPRLSWRLLRQVGIWQSEDF
jgi:hypothetical protein